MTFLRFLFGVASLLAVMVGVVGGLTGMGAPFYLWALVVACVASMAWGLVVKLQDERGDMTECREQVWARPEGGPPFNIEDVFALRNQKWDNAPDPTDPRSYGVWDDNEPELPYRPPIRTENIYRGPVWPNEIGSVE